MTMTTGSRGQGVRLLTSAGRGDGGLTARRARAFAPALLACLGVACGAGGEATSAGEVAASAVEAGGGPAAARLEGRGAGPGAAEAARGRAALAAPRAGKEKGAFAAARAGAGASRAGAAFGRAADGGAQAGAAFGQAADNSAKARAGEAKAARAARAGSAAGAELDVERYELAGSFDWSESRLYASVTVTLGAKAAPPPRVVLDSRVAAVTGVHLASGEALAFEVDREAGTLAVELGGRAAPGAAFVIDYEASTPYGSGLFGSTPLAAYPAREGDPNPARVVYTFSEPELARDWMPSHDDPADGAFFSIDLHVGYGERLIANGDLVADSTNCGGEGRMKYATSYPLPTYLMAFALGEFEVEEKKGPHGLPLSVWHRPGLPGDYEQTLRDLSRLVKRYEGLTGVPYPYEKYALVLVPDFFGGEENVSISFQAEADSSQPGLVGDNVLTAHELAHQWFGDLVTVATWDDLWIKEGMASLLEWEGTRSRLDRDGRGLANGDVRRVAPGEAVRDLSLPAEEKYTSGPYDRAAWLLAQVRHLAGEGPFWAALRQVLNEHRFGSIGTDAFLEAFRPALGDANLARVRQAVDAKALPALAVEAIDGGARVTLSDPEGALLVPLTVAWHRAGGAVETVELPLG
ncbi:MAG TPA: M1 family aminopeptidase, partial [Polyangiaceae bacterium]|nr:M1 family aminopeptidase [Polyangiaceae bacterium]